MTYVEFYDKTSVENITACLTFRPDKVVFLGDDPESMWHSIGIYREVTRERGLAVEFSCETVSKTNLNDALQALQKIVDEHQCCRFDLTGGDELLNLALGIIFQRNPDKDIRLHKFNLQDNQVVDCDQDGKEVRIAPPTLSVREQIRIYGGDILYGDVHGRYTYQWEFPVSFRYDFDTIWRICRKDVRQWNSQIAIFEAAEVVGKCSENKLITTANINVLDHKLRRSGGRFQYIADVVKPLLDEGLLVDYRNDGVNMTVRYKNPQIKRCLSKAGQALELKIFMTAREVKDRKGQPIYNDALNGAVIDWDGMQHNERKDEVYDTENEIDVLLMRGVVPVFISCKNGSVDAEELYKLSTVAHRFGAKYAKKVLIANAIPPGGGVRRIPAPAGKGHGYPSDRAGAGHGGLAAAGGTGISVEIKLDKRMLPL